jgi:O-methyltransferase
MPKRLAASLMIAGIRAEGRSMVSARRMWNLYELCSNPTLPDGAFVECGVARGGCVALMSFVSRGRRAVWGFDSFEGMPELTEEDEGSGQDWVGFRCSGPNGLREAQSTLDRFCVSGSWVKLVPGYFEDTLPRHDLSLTPIALLRLDNDWYRSTKYCLERLYHAVVPDGAVLIDDYYAFTGCRRAVDEFRSRHAITSPLITTEADSEVYWFKR